MLIFKVDKQILKTLALYILPIIMSERRNECKTDQLINDGLHIKFKQKPFRILS